MTLKVILMRFQDVLVKGDPSRLKDDKNNHNHLHKVNLRNNQLKGNIILGNYGVSLIFSSIIKLFLKLLLVKF